LRNNKPDAVDVEISLRFGGRANRASDGGEITLSPYREEDWVQYRGDPAVNNSSAVLWRLTLEAGEVIQPTVDYHFFARH
jgi:hypothetical protein